MSLKVRMQMFGNAKDVYTEASIESTCRIFLCHSTHFTAYFSAILLPFYHFPPNVQGGHVRISCLLFPLFSIYPCTLNTEYAEDIFLTNIIRDNKSIYTWRFNVNIVKTFLFSLCAESGLQLYLRLSDVQRALLDLQELIRFQLEFLFIYFYFNHK